MMLRKVPSFFDSHLFLTTFNESFARNPVVPVVEQKKPSIKQPRMRGAFLTYVAQ